MTGRLRTVTTAAALLWMAAPAAGQRSEGGRFEVGAFVSRRSIEADQTFVQPDFGAGVRVAWHPFRILALEVAASRTPTVSADTPQRIDLDDVGVTAVASWRIVGSNRIYAGVGYGWTRYGGGDRGTDGGPQIIFGDRVPVSRFAALRLEARGGYRSGGTTLSSGSALHLSLDAGVSVYFGERAPADADADLIPDRRDRCPDTSAGMYVNLDGCPRDDDGDRVPDGIDRCVGTPSARAVDDYGCDADGDGDGVPDGLDRCPATTPGTTTDEYGCDAVLDSDGDGVLDTDDRCAETVTGTPVDAVGCALLFEVVEGEQRPLILNGVNFAFGRADLEPTANALLEAVAASLLAHPEARIEITGYTDDRGSPEQNVALSQSRAESVRDFLVARGVDGVRMVAVGAGQSNPVASNATEEGRAANRRVELRLLSDAREPERSRPGAPN